MKIYIHKFGGVGLKSASRIRKLIDYLRGGGYKSDNIIVCSAISGVTRLLERLFNVVKNLELDQGFKKNEIEGWIEQFELLHMNLIEELFTEESDLEKAKQDFRVLLDDLHRIAFHPNKIDFDRADVDHSRIKACILRFGELASSRIVSNYLTFCGVSNYFFDSRDFIKTVQIEGNPAYDHSNAQVDFIETKKMLNEIMVPLLDEFNVFVCQGFIARDVNTGEDTLLGLDGSDYTASIIATSLDARGISFWKDVKGVMSSDPKKNPDAKRYPYLSRNDYFKICEDNNSWPVRRDAIDLLSHKNIPAYVKWLDNPSADGTTID